MDHLRGSQVVTQQAAQHTNIYILTWLEAGIIEIHRISGTCRHPTQCGHSGNKRQGRELSVAVVVSSPIRRCTHLEVERIQCIQYSYALETDYGFKHIYIYCAWSGFGSSCII